MTGVIILSSDSDEGDSDVEIVSSCSHFVTQTDPLPLHEVRVDVDALNVTSPKHYNDIKDLQWTFSEQKHKRQKSDSFDLREEDTATKPKQDTEKKNLPPNDFHTSNPTCCKNVQQQNYAHQLKRRCLDSQAQHPKKIDNTIYRTPIVKLKRLTFFGPQMKQHFSRDSVTSSKERTQMSLNISLKVEGSETPECSRGLRTTPESVSLNWDQVHPQMTDSSIGEEEEKRNEFKSKGLHIEKSYPLETPGDLDRGTPFTDTRLDTINEDAMGGLSNIDVPSPSAPFTSQEHFNRKAFCTNIEELRSDKSYSGQSFLLTHSSPYCPHTVLIPPEPINIDSVSHTTPASEKRMRQLGPASTSEVAPAENTPEEQLKGVMTDEASSNFDPLDKSTLNVPPLSVIKIEDLDCGFGSEEYNDDLENDSQEDCTWLGDLDALESKESISNMNFRASSKEDRRFVCPVAFNKLLSGPAWSLMHNVERSLGPPEMLSRQNLGLVYSTIEEKYTEGTLQLLSDLLQPGYYPPKDITHHLLHGILLDPQCPDHLCVQAFNILMRTQKHHIADKITLPWDWERLTTIMANKDQTTKHRIEVVRMLLEYVVQTLEDDFQEKYLSSRVHLSIAKATLSCDQRFSNVRDVIEWLFHAIKKSTEDGESLEATRERNEQVRIVSILQRMLSLALKVDRSPTLTSVKLSQELFHMLIGKKPSRAHRMLLLETLQSKPLRCKLLVHLLGYTCPQISPLPMSLGLLLHFLKNCTLAPDPEDGADSWKKWQELVHLIWMLLLSYNNAMEGYLSSSANHHGGKGRSVVYRQEDVVSKPAVCEAVEAFRSRSQNALGQVLPLHVEESLSYLQDYLINLCQC